MLDFLVGIDPGPEKSGFAWRDGCGVWRFSHSCNWEMELTTGSRTLVAIEEIVGKFVKGQGWLGQSVMDTARWSGRFEERAIHNGAAVVLIPRSTVSTRWTGTATAKPSVIKAAIVDKFGGKEKAIGTKRYPGPFYGTRTLGDHVWMALAVALTAEMYKGE